MILHPRMHEYIQKLMAEHDRPAMDEMEEGHWYANAYGQALRNHKTLVKASIQEDQDRKYPGNRGRKAKS